MSGRTVSDLAERLISPISTAELERRWRAVRAAMEAQHVDVLVMQNSNEFSGGYVKWFTDLPAGNGTVTTVIFPRDDLMTVVAPGPFGVDMRPAADDPVRRGVKRLLAAPNFMGASFTNALDLDNIDKAMAAFSGATIGLVAQGSMGHALGEHLKRGNLGNARFVDATELVDATMAIKSDEEIALIRATAALQDRAMRAAFDAIRPGMRDIEVAAVAETYARKAGAEYGLFMGASAPVGEAVMIQPRHLQNRTVRAGDQFVLLVETAGPGGFFTELGRTCVLGSATQSMKDEFAFALEAQVHTAGLLRPGASCADIWDSYNDFMAKNGRPPEQRLHCHGQGYHLVERPLVRFDETMPIAARMNIAVHPMYRSADTYTWICDNYLVGARGVERLHAFPQEIVELR
ncbi:MAG: aminopeptidase P family protein [Hyphomicrobiales bacterium]|nr:aminopeptidase P family protein [Hyphomicrobiales bacterium]